MRGNIFTHTHPSGGSFSPDDILVMYRTRASGFRVRTLDNKLFEANLDYEHPFFKRFGSRSQEKLLNSINRYEDEVRKEFGRKTLNKQMTVEYANKHHFREVWTRMSKGTSYFNYKETI